MASVPAEKLKEPEVAEDQREQTDGFHLIIDALKLNGVETIYRTTRPSPTFARTMAGASARSVSSLSAYAVSLACWRRPGWRLTGPSSKR